MTRGSWLCPTELDRSRVVDANERVRMIRRIGSGAVGAALIICAPWVGWWTLILFALSTLNFAVVERRIHSSSRPERVSAWAIVITMLLIATGVALSGGPRSPMLPWMVLPAGMVAARFRPRVVIAALVLTILITLVATVGVHPLWALENPVSLIATLALLAGIVSIVWALQAAELHHRDEAILDPLTGLLNRHALVPRFLEISHQARLTDQPVCLVLCDVDSFKEVNDEHGHDRGDAVLRDIAYELRKRLRSFELVYRLGGEEFLTVLPGINLQEGEEVAERLREAVEQARPTDIPITISLGVSAARGAQVDYDTLFKAADEALYEAKRMGRNRVVAAPEQASGVDVLPSTDIAPSTPPVVSDALAPQLVG
jgi:diguanylate cyclase (GGDEF)-like protein